MNVKKSFKELKDAWNETNVPKLSDFKIGDFVYFESNINVLMEVKIISEEKGKILTFWYDVSGNEQRCWFSPKNLFKQEKIYA